MVRDSSSMRSVKEIRESLKMNQKQLADMLGVTVETVQTMEAKEMLPEEALKLAA